MSFQSKYGYLAKVMKNPRRGCFYGNCERKLGGQEVEAIVGNDPTHIHGLPSIVSLRTLYACKDEKYNEIKTGNEIAVVRPEHSK